MRSTTPLGVLDGGGRATVDRAGSVTLDRARWSLHWWIGADDRWHVPACEPAVRQVLVGASPVVETRMRVPSGDAVHRAYAARGPGGAVGVVIELVNDTKVPFALAMVLRGHTGAIEVDGASVRLDGGIAVHSSKAPARAAVLGASHDPAAVLVFPLAHTASLRLVLPAGAGSASTPPDRYPSAQQVAAGWAAQAARGARIEVPDRQLRDDLRASTRFLLLDPVGRDARAALRRLGLLPSRSPLLASSRRRPPDVTTPEAAGWGDGAPAEVVHRVLDVLVAEDRPGLALSPGVPESWYGRGWEVHDLPTRHGVLSYGIRWHGERPALLWELAASGARAARLSVPRLDPSWSSTERRGEVLLAPVPITVEPERRRGLTIPVTIEPVRRGS